MKNILIFGDSYSTFDGYIPNGYATYYPKLDVNNVEETWWKKVMQRMQGNLIENNSWSGSTICYTTYDGVDCSKTSSFIYRYRQLKKEGFFEKNRVDTVFLFGGTNDSWCNAPLGEIKFFDWEEKDLFNVLPAICYFAHVLRSDLPNAEIVFVLNTNLKQEIQDCIEEVSKRYRLSFVRLMNINKESGHPTAKGMKEIANQILEVMH